MAASITRVLWLSNETPDRAGQGGQRRQFFQIEALAKAGCDVVVVTLAGAQSDAGLRGFAEVHREAPLWRGRVPRPDHRARMRRRTAEPWDVVWIAHLESWPRWGAWAKRTGAPVLLDLHNVEDTGALGRQWNDTMIAATAVVDAVAVCSPREAERLAALPAVQPRQVLFLPHGIDPGEWAVPSAIPDAPPRGHRVRLFGSWGWAPNRAGLDWFLQAVWPRLRATDPSVQCEIAGTGLAGLTLPEGITPVGRVDDLPGFLRTADAVAVLVRDGLGAPVKYYEAVAAGAPVFATVDAAPDHQDWAQLVSDDPDAWVAALMTLNAADRQRAQTHAQAAHAERSWASTVTAAQQWMAATRRTRS